MYATLVQRFKSVCRVGPNWLTMYIYTPCNFNGNLNELHIYKHSVYKKLLNKKMRGDSTPSVSKVYTHNWFWGCPNLRLHVSLSVLLYLSWAYLKYIFYLKAEGRYLIIVSLQAYWKNAHYWLCYSWAENAVRIWKRFHLWWKQAAKGN